MKRFMGKSSAEELVNEILMLTKMNWNSGDGLYKILPVTLDFAKTLSRVAKQDLVVYDRPYDFRYFIKKYRKFTSVYNEIFVERG